MRWELMDTAPRDGTPVWLAIDAGDGDVDVVLGFMQPKLHFLTKKAYWGTGNIKHWLDLYACEPYAWRIE